MYVYDSKPSIVYLPIIWKEEEEQLFTYEKHISYYYE